MQQLLIATKNAHKTHEFRAMLSHIFEVSDLCSFPEIESPEETGGTFAENASIKALAASRRFGGWVLADDSGLCVDSLGGAPGVVSARYAGPDASDADNRLLLLQRMAGFNEPHQRKARFQCVLVLAQGGHVRALFQGAVEGTLLRTVQGSGGFGYDSLFVPDGHSESFGVLSPEIKNAISHRSKALAALKQWLGSQQSFV